MHTCGVGPVDGRAIDGLALLLCLVKPATGYRVYDVQHAQLVCSRRLLEVSKDLLDENRLGLDGQGDGSAFLRERAEGAAATAAKPYLDVIDTEVGEGLDLGAGDAGRLKNQHGIQARIEFCYWRRHLALGVWLLCLFACLLSCLLAPQDTSK